MLHQHFPRYGYLCADVIHRFHYAAGSEDRGLGQAFPLAVEGELCHKANGAGGDDRRLIGDLCNIANYFYFNAVHSCASLILDVVETHIGIAAVYSLTDCLQFNSNFLAIMVSVDLHESRNRK